MLWLQRMGQGLLLLLGILLLVACGMIEVIPEPVFLEAQTAVAPPTTPIFIVRPTVSAEPAQAEATAVSEPVTTANEPFKPITYDFNVTSIADTQCWRVRTDTDGTLLGESIEPTLDREHDGRGSLLFRFKLPPPRGVGVQLDQLEGGSTCSRSLPMMPSAGQVRLWAYLDTGRGQTEPPTLAIEPFFAPINMKHRGGGDLFWLHGIKTILQPNEWTYVCWDATNSPNSVGFGANDWREGYLQAFGLEIKYNNSGLRTPYEGIVYIDDIQLLDEPENSCAHLN